MKPNPAPKKNWVDPMRSIANKNPSAFAQAQKMVRTQAPRPGSVPGAFTGSEPKAGMYQAPTVINYKYKPNAPAAPAQRGFNLGGAAGNVWGSIMRAASKFGSGIPGAATGRDVQRGFGVLKNIK